MTDTACLAANHLLLNKKTGTTGWMICVVAPAIIGPGEAVLNHGLTFLVRVSNTKLASFGLLESLDWSLFNLLDFLTSRTLSALCTQRKIATVNVLFRLVVMNPG